MRSVPVLWRSCRLSCFLLLVMLALTVPVDPVAGQQRGLGSIAGIAADSLHERPLAGALVTVEGLGRSAVTNGEGAFTIGSVPAGSARLVVFHPLLDTIGISLVTPRLMVVTDSTVNVVVGVPSPSAMLRLKCGSDAMSAILGSVSRADDPDPPSDAFVRLSWTEVLVARAVGVRHIPHELTAPVTAGGTFTLCRIPPEVYGELFAFAGSDTSGTIAARLGDAPRLALVGLTLPGADVERIASEVSEMTTLEGPPLTIPAMAPPPGALRRGAARIAGRVVDSTGAPVRGARVSLRGAVGAATTDPEGRFSLANQPSGSGTLVARKLGFPMTEAPVTMRASGTNEVLIRMETGPVAVLSEVVVRANRQLALGRIGFYSRKQRKRGVFFLDPDQMDVMANRASLANVLAGAANLTYRQGQIGGRPQPPVVRVAGTGEVRMTRRHSCVSYIVDGTIWADTSSSPAEFMLPSEIGAVEVYYAGEAPPEIPYAYLARGCETVVLWTRDYIGRGGRRSR